MRASARSLVPLLVLLAAVAAHAADKISVAAAANLTYVIGPLSATFKAAHPGVEVTSTLGASGNLVHLIEQGAPYDVFLSADVDFPQKLIAAGGADQASLTVFALGKLVLWTTRPGPAPVSIAALVRDPSVHKIAIANPRTAPYGRAAQETLAHLGLTEAAAPKLVFGESISQTAQYVESGNADAGFVALALVASPDRPAKGHWIEVADDLHAPIAQGAVLTLRGASNPAARSYLAFLSSPAARAIFARFGYGLPTFR